MASYTYDSWGVITASTGTSSGTIGALNPLRYRGYYYDTETGLYYVSSRYYDSKVGRFINADKIDFLGAEGSLISYNLFAYCGNNPITGNDPTGHFSWSNVFNIAAVVTVVAIAVVAVISTGGSAAPPIIAAASALAGMPVSATAITASATAVAITGTAIMGGSASAHIQESRNGGKDYIQADSNKKANQWAQEVGYDSAEDLKSAYVGSDGHHLIWLEIA